MTGLQIDPGTSIAFTEIVRVIISNLEKRAYLKPMLIVGYILVVLLISGLARA